MATPKLLEAACKGSHASQGGPDDDGSDENFVYGGPKTPTGPLSRQAHGSPMSVCRSKRRKRWGRAPCNRLAGAGCKPP